MSYECCYKCLKCTKELKNDGFDSSRLGLSQETLPLEILDDKGEEKRVVIILEKEREATLASSRTISPCSVVPHHFSRPGSFLCVFWGISPGSYNRLHEGCQREAILNRRSLSFMEVNSTHRHFLSSHFVLELYLRKRRQEPSIVPEGASPKLKPKRVFQNLVSLSFLISLTE